MRSCSSDLVSRRETCIWEIPTRRAISVWVRQPMLRGLVDFDAFQGGVVDDVLRQLVEGRERDVLLDAQALVDVGERHPQVPGDLGGSRRSPGLVRQLGGRAVDGVAQLFQPARHSHRPALVAEVPPHLAGDRGHGIGQEVRLPAHVVPVDGVDQSDRGHLREVFHRLAAFAEATGDVPGEREVLAHQPVPQRVVARRVTSGAGEFLECRVLIWGQRTPRIRPEAAA